MTHSPEKRDEDRFKSMLVAFNGFVKTVIDDAEKHKRKPPEYLVETLDWTKGVLRQI